MKQVPAEAYRRVATHDDLRRRAQAEVIEAVPMRKCPPSIGQPRRARYGFSYSVLVEVVVTSAYFSVWSRLSSPRKVRVAPGEAGTGHGASRCPANEAPSLITRQQREARVSGCRACGAGSGNTRRAGAGSERARVLTSKGGRCSCRSCRAHPPLYSCTYTRQSCVASSCCPVSCARGPGSPSR